MFKWKIYYGDGTVYDQNQSPYHAPAVNVQAIALASKDHGYTIFSLVDYYWYEADADTWLGGDQIGYFDYMTRKGVKQVLFGRYITDENFQAIINRIVSDPDLPEKTGWFPNEPRGVNQ